jgi:large subunit ribosomal protein L13
MKSVSSISQNDITEKWYLVDATGSRIGVLASKVSELLQGKNNPKVKKYHDPKVKVIVINTNNLDVTPKRGLTKFYSAYSGFPGGIKFSNLEDLMRSDSTKPVTLAVKGMLPRTKRGEAMLANLKVFTGSEFPHEAQQPEVINIKNLKL